MSPSRIPLPVLRLPLSQPTSEPRYNSHHHHRLSDADVGDVLSRPPRFRAALDAALAGRHRAPRVPVLTAEQIAPYLREAQPGVEQPCAHGPRCVANRLPGMTALGIDRRLLLREQFLEQARREPHVESQQQHQPHDGYTKYALQYLRTARGGSAPYLCLRVFDPFQAARLDGGVSHPDNDDLDLSDSDNDDDDDNTQPHTYRAVFTTCYLCQLYATSRRHAELVRRNVHPSEHVQTFQHAVDVVGGYASSLCLHPPWTRTGDGMLRWETPPGAAAPHAPPDAADADTWLLNEGSSTSGTHGNDRRWNGLVGPVLQFCDTHYTLDVDPVHALTVRVVEHACVYFVHSAPEDLAVAVRGCRASSLDTHGDAACAACVAPCWASLGPAQPLVLEGTCNAAPVVPQAHAQPVLPALSQSEATVVRLMGTARAALPQVNEVLERVHVRYVAAACWSDLLQRYVSDTDDDAAAVTATRQLWDDMRQLHDTIVEARLLQRTYIHRDKQRQALQATLQRRGTRAAAALAATLADVGASPAASHDSVEAALLQLGSVEDPYVTPLHVPGDEATEVWYGVDDAGATWWRTQLQQQHGTVDDAPPPPGAERNRVFMLLWLRVHAALVLRRLARDVDAEAEVPAAAACTRFLYAHLDLLVFVRARQPHSSPVLVPPPHGSWDDELVHACPHPWTGSEPPARRYAPDVARAWHAGMLLDVTRMLAAVRESHVPVKQLHPLAHVLAKVDGNRRCDNRKWPNVLDTCVQQSASVAELTLDVLRCLLLGLYPDAYEFPTLAQSVYLQASLVQLSRDPVALRAFLRGNANLTWFAWKEYVLFVERIHTASWDMLVDASATTTSWVPYAAAVERACNRVRFLYRVFGALAWPSAETARRLPATMYASQRVRMEVRHAVVARPRPPRRVAVNAPDAAHAEPTDEPSNGDATPPSPPPPRRSRSYFNTMRQQKRARMQAQLRDNPLAFTHDILSTSVHYDPPGIDSIAASIKRMHDGMVCYASRDLRMRFAYAVLSAASTLIYYAARTHGYALWRVHALPLPACVAWVREFCARLREDDVCGYGEYGRWHVWQLVDYVARRVSASGASGANDDYGPAIAPLELAVATHSIKMNALRRRLTAWLQTAPHLLLTTYMLVSALHRSFSVTLLPITREQQRQTARALRAHTLVQVDPWVGRSERATLHALARYAVRHVCLQCASRSVQAVMVPDVTDACNPRALARTGHAVSVRLSHWTDDTHSSLPALVCQHRSAPHALRRAQAMGRLFRALGSNSDTSARDVVDAATDAHVNAEAVQQCRGGAARKQQGDSARVVLSLVLSATRLYLRDAGAGGHAADVRHTLVPVCMLTHRVQCKRVVYGMCALDGGVTAVTPHAWRAGDLVCEHHTGDAHTGFRGAFTQTHPLMYMQSGPLRRALIGFTMSVANHEAQRADETILGRHSAWLASALTSSANKQKAALAAAGGSASVAEGTTTRTGHDRDHEHEHSASIRINLRHERRLMAMRRQVAYLRRITTPALACYVCGVRLGLWRLNQRRGTLRWVWVTRPHLERKLVALCAQHAQQLRDDTHVAREPVLFSAAQAATAAPDAHAPPPATSVHPRAAAPARSKKPRASTWLRVNNTRPLPSILRRRVVYTGTYSVSRRSASRRNLMTQ